MESPVRKLQKRNDYNRHKLLRKIKRRRKAAAEQQAHAAEKALKKKLRITPLKFESGKNPKDINITYVDNPTYNEELGLFKDDNGRVVGDSIVLPELEVTPQLSRANEFRDQRKRFHYEQPLETVSPEFEALTMFPLFKVPIKQGFKKLANQANKLHVGDYYLKPQYDNFSYIRQVGDDAVEDMLRTGQMRTSDAIFDEEYERLVQEVGEEEAEKIMFPSITDLNSITANNGVTIRSKTFNRNMFFTGRPFYGPKRTNYIITQPRPITKQKDLTKKGLEWFEDGHKGHTRVAKRIAVENGVDPNVAPGRIVDPMWNGDTNIIPLSEFGQFDLYRPVSKFNFPFYRRIRFE